MRALAALLMTAFLCVKLLTPTGWMPAPAPNGLSVMLCTGDGAAAAWIDSAGTVHKGHQPADGPGPERDGKDRGGKDPCPFGSLTASLALPTGLASAPPPPAASAAVPLVRSVTAGSGLAAPPPPPTGPPAFV
ncbi:MAG: DUF2946 family protein [Pseudomonadota bacterium]